MEKIRLFVCKYMPILVPLKKLICNLPYFLLAIPCVLFVRMVKFCVVIRFSQIDGSNFGHLWSPEIYLCERDLGWQGQKGIIDIFYTLRPVVSQILLKKWQGLIRFFPNNRLLGVIDNVNRWFGGYENHIITFKNPAPGAVSTSGLNRRLLGRVPGLFVFHQDAGMHILSKTKPHIVFTPEEKNTGKRLLKEMGIPEGMQYICFHVRDKAYKKNVCPSRDWSYHDFRDADIQNYLPAAARLTQEGFYMVRMGVKVEQPLNTDNPRIIDYALKYRSEFMDFYLGANCRFFIASLTGINIIPTLFRKPTVLVNVIPYFLIYSWTEYDVLIFKRLWLRDEKRFLTFREILESDIRSYSFSDSYVQHQIEVVENTPEEITAATLEMNERLKGSWKETEEDKELQKYFWNIFYSTHLDNSSKPSNLRIGSEFLRQNSRLLLG